MEKVLINYTDNTKQGVRKKKVQNTINRIDHMIYDIHNRAEELQWRIDELEDNIYFMEDVKLDLEKNGKVDKRDLEECEILHMNGELPFYDG